MRQLATTRRLGFVIAAMVFLFAFTTTAQAAVKKPTLNSLLANSGVTFKIAKLDRTDGFLFGLTFKGKKIPSITIAPGLGRMLLVQVGADEMIFQGNGAGKMELISATGGDLTTALCISTTIIDFITGLQTCQSDPLCLFSEIVSLITGITTCTATVPTT
jgi:hypothetical protein